MSVIDLSDINYLNIFPFIGKAAKIEISSIDNTGGVLKAGNYVFALRYFDRFNTPTSFFASSSPASVTVDGLNGPIGAEGESQTERAIRLKLSNLDTFYDRFQLAVIPQYQGVIGTPLLLPTRTITGSEAFVVYTGSENGIESSLEEIVIDKAVYNKAKAITQVEGSMYMGNLEAYPEINYQPYANNIEVEAVVKEYEDATVDDSDNMTRMDSSPGKYGDPINLIYRGRGFKRGEVYALYISFLLNDGTETPAFHIPGGVGSGSQKSPISPDDEEVSAIAGTDENGEPVGKNFHFQSHSLMGYWENEDELYPYSEDWEVWDVDDEGEGYFTGVTYAGQNVRHHKMPTADLNPYYDSDSNTVRVLGLSIKNVKIPDSMKDRIKAVRIHHAKRTPQNQLMLGQSFALRAIDDSPVAGALASRVTNDGETAPVTYVPVMYTVNPFDQLVTKENIQGLTHVKIIGEIDRTDTDLFTAEGADNIRIFENLISKFEPKITGYAGYREVQAKSYITSYSFPETDGASNTVVRLQSNGFEDDFDNTNGEEKIAILINNLNTKQFDFGLGDEDDIQLIPTYLLELCQFRRNLYLDFDTQDLVFTGFQFNDIDLLCPSVQESGSPSPSSEAYELGEVYGGDTFIGVYVSRHSKWLEEGDKVTAALRCSIIESKYYPDHRLPGEQVYEQWYPGTSDPFDYNLIVWKDSQPTIGKEGDVFPGTPIYYNNDYRMDNTPKPAFPFPKRRTIVENFPTRVIRSRQEKVTEEEDLFRQFLAEDYIDLPTEKGDLVKLSNLNNILIPHLQKTLFRTRGREELQTGDFRAFLGSGDIFEIPPEQMYETDSGYAGLQVAKAAVITEYGYFFVDIMTRKIFHLTTEGLKEVSAHGLEQFFFDNLEFNFERYGFTAYDQASEDFSIEVAWDPEYRRYIITKKDVKFTSNQIIPEEDESPSPSGSPSPYPTPEELEFDVTTQRFIDPLNTDSRLEWDDERFFETDDFTISYSPELDVWISFHDYFPDMYFYNHDTLFSAFSDLLFLHNQKDQRGTFYNQKYEAYIEYVDNINPKISKTVSALFIDTEVKSVDGKEVRDKTVTKARVSNTYQDTGDIDVSTTSETGNIRKAQGFWRINQLRNALNEDGEVDPNKEWFEKEWLSDRYHYVKLAYDNADNNTIYIISSELNIKTSLR